MSHFALSKIVFYSILSFIFGLALSPYSEIFYFLFLVPALLIKNKKLVFILLLIFLAGIFYYDLFSRQQFILSNFEDQQITIRGRVVEQDRNVVLVESKDGEDINEKVILWIDGKLDYGKVIELTGKPVPVRGDYRDFYYKDDISVSFFDPQVKIIGNFNNLKTVLFSFRDKIKLKIERGLSYPQSAIVKALLLGDRTDIPDNLSDKFSIVGVAHLLAISGTHIIIIAGVLISLASFLKIKYKTIFSLSLLALFIILVGAPASALRAGLMGSVFIFAQKIKRQVRSFRSLIYIAFLLLIYNPLLIGSVAFQLSFSATAGIILFSSKLKKLLISTPRFWELSLFSNLKRSFASFFKKYAFLTDLLVITISAQIFTLPLVYFYFDNFPFLAPFANLILVPLLPVVMILAPFSVFLSFLLPPLIIFYPLQILVTFILFIVNIFYKLYLLC
jgi:competence protein ComEC